MIFLRKIRYSILIIVALLALVSVASAFPSQVVANVIYPGTTPSYFDINIISGGDDDLPNGHYTGWCSDSDFYIDPSNSPFTFTPYSTLTLPIPAGPMPEDWKKVNYIINNNVGKRWKASQMAFWFYDGGIDNPNPLYPDATDSADFETLKTAANANSGFEPKCDQKYAVVLYHPGLQTIFLENDIDRCPDPGIPVPEFPSLALPAGMMIGLIGLVYVIKRREN